MNNEGSVKTLADAFSQLKGIKEDVEKKVAEKQSLNSRLYFLSTLQLLTLMSSIVPRATVPISELFPGLDELVLSDHSISRVVRSGEALDLPRKVTVFQDSGVPRSSEEWLSDLESTLRDFHAKRIATCFKQFSGSGFAWDQSFDNEVAYIAYLAWLSRQVEAAVAAERPRAALAALKSVLVAVLQAGVAAMKPSHGTPGHGIIAAIVRNQFGRKNEHAEKRKYNEMLAHLLMSHIDLLDQLISDPDDFHLLWKAAFKLTAHSFDSPDALHFTVNCFDYTVPYGFEMHSLNYLEAFILTPTSERRVMHVFLTMKRGLGCLVSGAPGSEKTETLKHLALVCGRMMQVCYITPNTLQDKVVKFLVGCALGGFWGCIEEVHSFPQVSLCTLVHYIRSISAAMTAASRVVIDGYQVKPKAGFAIFSTSSSASPQLPRTFQEQFRTLAVSRPDLSTIATILLRTYGFEDAQKHGQMIAKAMHLLEAPMVSLSSGATLHIYTKATTRTLVRLVRSMIEIAMRHYINDMQYLINNAFRQVYGLGLLAGAMQTLDETLATLFQSTHNDIVAQIKSRSVSEQIVKSLAGEEVVSQDRLQRRCQHLWWLLFGARRPWVFLIGASLSGKSFTISLLSKIVATHTGHNFRVHHLGPKSSVELLSDLYQFLAQSANAWFPPTPPSNFCSEAALRGTAPGCSPADWVHVDAQRCEYAVDSLLTLIKTYPRAELKLLFETDQISSASPSIVSECGLLYVDDSEVDVSDFFTVRMRELLTGEFASFLFVTERLYKALLAPVLDHLAAAAVTMRVPAKASIQQFSKLFQALVGTLVARVNKEKKVKVVPLSREPNSLIVLKRTTSVNLERASKLQRATVHARRPDLKANVLRYLGGVRKTLHQLKPEQCIEALFVMSLIHSLGRLSVNQDAFAVMFLSLVLKQTEEFAYNLQSELKDGAPGLISDLVFSVKTLTWMKITTFNPLEEQLAEELYPTRGHRDSAMSAYESTGVQLNVFSASAGRYDALISTESSRRLSYWVEFGLTHHCDLLVFGPHQCGKSAVVVSVAKDMLSKANSSLVPYNITDSSSAAAAQESVQMSMEHFRKYAYGGLGATEYYVLLDDMNMDASSEIYDLFRFRKENGGWYNQGFVTIEDVTTVLVHSYTEGKSRPIWPRALRHFLLVHKEAYRDSEVTAIFRRILDANATENSPEPTDMHSVAEESVLALVALFSQLQVLHKKSERVWCHISLSNFVLALKFVSQFDMIEDIDIPTYLKMWTFMYNRYFFDQFGKNPVAVSEELRATVEESLLTLIEKFVEDDEVVRGIREDGFLMPTIQDLENAAEGASSLHEFSLLDSASISEVIARFHASYAVCVQRHSQLLKYLHSLIFQIEDRFSAFYYFYLSALYDILSSTPSVIVRSESQRTVIKPLIFIAAETLKVKVVELNIDEGEDSLAEYMMGSFKVVSPHHLPTELKYSLKHLVEEAIVLNRRVVVVVTIVDAKQLNRPLTQHLLDLANDIMSGGQLRLSGFAPLYREFVDRFRSGEGAMPRTDSFNEQLLQMLLDRMRRNTTIFFLLEGSSEEWTRSPLHPPGVLERFKHQHRTTYNKSRVVDFDGLRPPYAFVKYIAKNSHLLSEWTLDFNNKLLLAIGARLAALLKLPMLDEFTYECLIHCSKRILQQLEERRNRYKVTFSRAVQQIDALDRAVDSAPARIKALEEEAKRLEGRVQKQREKKVRLDAAHAKALAVDYSVRFLAEISARRDEPLQRFEQQKAAWAREVLGFDVKHEEVREAEKAAHSPVALRVLFLFHMLLNQADPPAEVPPEAMDQIVRKLLPQLVKKPKDVLKKLRKLEPESIPNLRAHLESLEMSSPRSIPKLIRSMQGILSTAQTLRDAHDTMRAELAQIDQEAALIPQRVEAKLREVKEAQMGKVAAIQAKLEQTSDRLARTNREIEQIAGSRPKLQKFLNDLRASSDAWSSFLSSSKRHTDLEDSILSSFLVLKGGDYPQGVRNAIVRTIVDVMREQGFSCHASSTLSARLVANHRTFAYECTRRGLPDSAFFRDNIAALRTVLQLQLPFPLMYDPYEIAAGYVSRTEADNGLIVGKVSNDLTFDRKMRECMIEGRPVLCIDPSQTLLKAIYPILAWKAQFFVSTMRGLSTANLKFATHKGQVTMHPDFRLYISCKVRPAADILQVTTAISFDAADQESWEAFTSMPLLKLLDEHMHQSYQTFLIRQHDQAFAADEAEGEILTLLSENDMDKVLVTDTVLDSLLKAWRKMKALPLDADEETFEKARRPSLIPVADSKPLNDLRTSPREKLKRLLTEMFDFKQTLQLCAPALQDYAVPEKILHSIIITCVLEYIQTIAIPLESQWDSFADSMAYGVFVRLCQSLPWDKRLTFTAIYTFYKHHQASPVPRNEYMQVLEDVVRADEVQHPLDYLKDRYPQLFPGYFSPGSPSFTLFLTRETYSEAKLPDNFPAIYRLLLFAYLRRDLLSQFASNSVEMVLGPRFLWVPRIDFELYVSDHSNMPTAVFFEESTPIPLIKYTAEAKGISVVHTEPLLDSVMRTGKVEIRKVGRAINPIMTALKDNYGSSRWVVIENLHTISGLEAEVLAKFLLYKMPEECGEGLRCWVVLQGRPSDHPQWNNLLKHCQRVLVPAPRTLKEDMLLWHYANTATFFAHYREYLSRKHMEHCGLEVQTAPKDPVRKRGTIVAQRKRTIMVENRSETIRDGMAFDLALVFSIMYYRNRTVEDLPNLWGRADARSLVDDFLACVPADSPRDLLRPTALTLLCNLLAPQFESHSVATLVSIVKQVFLSENGILMVQGENFEAVEYPLYQLEHLVPEKNLEILINKFPDEDHIQVTGLTHHHAFVRPSRFSPARHKCTCGEVTAVLLSRRLQEARGVLQNLSPLYYFLEGKTRLNLAVSQKLSVAESMSEFLSDLLATLPHSVAVSVRQSTHENVFTKVGNSFKAALSHTQDGFKLSDMRNSVLEKPPLLKDVLEACQVAEAQFCNQFLSVVRKALREMHQYLSYSRSALSVEDLSNLAALAQNSVPVTWREVSPCVCRQSADAAVWRAQVTAFFRQKLDWSCLDLTLLFAPSLLLQSVLRAAAVHSSQRFERLGFSVGDGLESPFQIKVTGLHIDNGAIVNNTLCEHATGEKLPPLRLTPAKLPKHLCVTYPEGVKIWMRNDVADSAAEASGRQPAKYESAVFLPIDLAAQPLWLLVSSSKPQGFWSRRGARIHL